jgi:hypothetical protein
MATNKPANGQQLTLPRIITVAYTTRVVDNIEEKLPPFTAPINYKDPAKIEDYCAEQRARFLDRARFMPYVATFDMVRIVDIETKRIRDFSRQAEVNEGKAPVALRVRNYLKSNFKDVWPSDLTAPTGNVTFVGFEVKRFLKILGLECCRPPILKPCPLSMWYGATNFRDIGKMILPDECQDMTLHYALQAHRPARSFYRSLVYVYIIKQLVVFCGNFMGTVNLP